MSLFSDDCPSSDSDNDADYVPDYSSDEEPRSCRMEVENKEANKEPESNDEYYQVENTKVKADDLFKSFLAECEAEIKAREVEAGLFVQSATKVSSEGSSMATSSTEVSKSVCDSPTECLAKKNNEGSSMASSSTEVSKSVCDSHTSAEGVAKKSSLGEEKIDVEVFDFAGETVCVSKDGASVSVLDEASDPDKSVKKPPVVEKKGLASVLGVIENKKRKLSTLQKSKLDWGSFKRQQGIEEELKKHNLGRGGFIERKRFLERSDLRAFEIERDMRLSKKKK